MATTALNTLPLRAGWRDYLELCKPKVVALIVFTALVGMLLASPGTVPLDVFFFGLLGIALASGSAAAVNVELGARRPDAPAGCVRGERRACFGF